RLGTVRRMETPTPHRRRRRPGDTGFPRCQCPPEVRFRGVTIANRAVTAGRARLSSARQGALTVVRRRAGDSAPYRSAVAEAIRPMSDFTLLSPLRHQKKNNRRKIPAKAPDKLPA